MKKGYYITAEIRVKRQENIDIALRELAILQQETLTEKGCDFFSIHQDTTDPMRFIMWERFDDEIAFKKHFDYPHTKNYTAMDLTEIIQFFQTDIL